jgi:hypothetical protein
MLHDPQYGNLARFNGRETQMCTRSEARTKLISLTQLAGAFLRFKSKLLAAMDGRD